MQNCSLSESLRIKRDKYSASQSQNWYKNHSIYDIPYASAVGSLMDEQVCIHPDIPYVLMCLKILVYHGIVQWKLAKMVMRYLECTKNSMLTFQNSDELRVVGYWL